MSPAGERLGRAAPGLLERLSRQYEALIESFAEPGFDSHPALDEHRVALLRSQAGKLPIFRPSEQGRSFARSRGQQNFAVLKTINKDRKKYAGQRLDRGEGKGLFP